jgi:hypothetical protein
MCLMSRQKFYVDYLLILILLFLSGFPAAVPIQESIRLVLLAISVFVFLKRRGDIDFQYIFVIIVFGFITLWHFYSFNIYEPRTAFGIFVRISIGYFVVKSIGIYFPKTYIEVMFHLTLISLIVWLPAFLFPSVKSLIAGARFFVPEGFEDANFFVYHTNFGDPSESKFLRNSGPFWEPGAFGGYLVLALIFLLIQYPKVIDKFKWKLTSSIITLGILSTFSTTTYLACFIIFIVVFLNQKISFSKFILGVGAVLFCYTAFLKLDFLSSKIDNHLDRTQDEIAYTNHRTRITSAIIDFADWKEYPLFGRGKFESSRFDHDVTAVNRNNGTTDFLVMFGLVGFIIYFYSYYLSFKNLMIFYTVRSNLAFFIVIIFLILGFSENYFLLPFFWSLVFMRAILMKNLEYVKN